MALIRVAQYSSTPGPVTDYQAQNAHLQAFTNQLMTQQFILDAGTAQPIIKQGGYVSHGGSLYVADADTAITGSPSDGSVYIRVSGTTSLTVEFVTDISGYAWNPVYTALTSGSYTILPYLIVKASTVWTRYNFNPNNQQFGNLGAVKCESLAVTGAISGATLSGPKTVDSVNEINIANGFAGGPLYLNYRGAIGAITELVITDGMGDGVVTIPINCASVNTGQGANELYPMNQAVRTTDNVSFANLVVTGAISGAVKLYPLIFESVSVTATSGHATVTISSLIIGQEVLVTATLTSANNYNAYVALPSGSEKYSIIPSSGSASVAIGGAYISSYSIVGGTPATVTRYFLVKRLT